MSLPKAGDKVLPPALKVTLLDGKALLPTMVSAWRYVPSCNGCKPATAAWVSR